MRLWESATIAHLRNKLRSGDVWVERSAGYRRFDSYLLSEPKAKPVVSALGLPLSADEWLAQRGQELDRRLKKFAQHLKRDALDDVRFRDDRLQISPVRTITTPDAEELASLIRSEEHTSELQSLMRISYAVFCLKKKTTKNISHINH